MSRHSVARAHLRSTRFFQFRMSLMFWRSFLLIALSGQACWSYPTNPISSGGTPGMMVIMSPRHPATFYFSSTDKLSQELRWDKDTRTLFAYVTYSLVSGGGEDEQDPSNYKTFELPFPTVILDQKNNLVALGDQYKSVHLGHLESGIFGPKVVLNNNVRLSAHRKNGSLSAKLIVTAK